MDNYDYTSPVGSFPANRYGLFDMGGNVWQWCEDFYDGQRGNRVLRGMSWRTGCTPANLLSSYRHQDPDDHRVFDVGFRCVLAGSSPE